jgi:hypothetical protein
VVLEFGPEHDDPSGHFATGDDAADAEICDQIANGTLIWFTARVSVRKAGVVLGEDYLGGCCYKHEQDFMEGGYYRDMIQCAIADAENTLARINGTAS